jgi:hypothetical protein
MRETENLNFSLELSDDNKSSDSKRLSKTSGFLRYDNPNLEDIIEFIKSKGLSDSTEKSLIEAAKKTPHGSLSNFRKNYMIHLNRINK